MPRVLVVDDQADVRAMISIVLRIHHFEIVEPHTTLLVESQLHVTMKPRPLLGETEMPWPLARIGGASASDRAMMP